MAGQVGAGPVRDGHPVQAIGHHRAIGCGLDLLRAQPAGLEHVLRVMADLGQFGGSGADQLQVADLGLQLVDLGAKGCGVGVVLVLELDAQLREVALGLQLGLLGLTLEGEQLLHVHTIGYGSGLGLGLLGLIQEFPVLLA